MLENILSLKDKFDVFLFDVYGVIWDGRKPIEGAVETMQELKKAGKKVILLSNGPVPSSKAEASNTARGFVKGAHYDKVVTSGDLVIDTFKDDDRRLKYYQLWRGNPDLFAGSRYSEVKNPKEADFVYIGVPQLLQNGVWQDCLSIEPFVADLEKMYDLDLPLICANPDMKAHESQYEEAVIRQGTIAQYYEDLGGDVEYFGKPYPQIFDFALQDETVEDERILMIGDTLETDILGGNSYGIKTALLEGGIATDNMQAEGFETMAEYCEEVGIVPDYIFKSF